MSAAHTDDAAAWERGHAAQAAIQAHHESSTGPADLLGGLSTTIAGLVGARRVVFSVLDPAGCRLVPQAEAHGISADELALLGTLTVDPGADDAASRVVLRNEVLRLDPGAQRPPSLAGEALLRLGEDDSVSVCWRAGNRPVGMVTAAGSTGGGFTDDDVRLLRTAAQTAGMVWRHTQAKAELAGLYDEAQEVNQTMDGFVSMIAHELRGPLTVISGYASMIARGDLGEPPEAWRRPLGFLVEHSERMQRLVDDLLLAARLRSGRQAPVRQRLDLRASVTAALEQATPGAELAGAQLRVHLPDEPVTVVADPEHLGIILGNLLSNALAYGGSPAQVEVTVTGEGVATALVADNGRGVPDDMRERIFDRFVRIEEWASPPGTGLGLYISRALATQLGGSLRVEASAPGRGTTFALRLPLASEAAGTPTASRGDHAGSPSARHLTLGIGDRTRRRRPARSSPRPGPGS